ncbi:DUF4082 domain-containing protein [Cellulomonas soli]|uniref:DUF4082 domain-containing protein n=1 Tax=Cellulomonas soli TaxID=931535 RepID=UPI003F85D5EF
MTNLYGATAPEMTSPNYDQGPPLALKHGFVSSVAATITRARYYASATEMAGRVLTAYLWVGADSTPRQSKTFTVPVTPGWVEIDFDTPQDVAAGTPFGIGIWMPAGAGVLNYGAKSAALPLTVGTLTITGAAYDAAAQTLGNPSTFTGTSSYLIDVEVAAVALAVNAGADQSVFIGAAPAELAATAVGGSGTKTFTWTQLSGPTGEFSAPSSATTTFTPSDVGTTVLRCIVTDSSGTAQDDVVVTASAMPTVARLAAINSSAGWTPTGGTVLAVLSDGSDATGITSTPNPTDLLLDARYGQIDPPDADEGFVVRVRLRKIGAGTGTLIGRLYDGSTLRSTVPVPIPSALGWVEVAFPAADVALVTPSTWTSGVRVTIAVTAAV